MTTDGDVPGTACTSCGRPIAPGSRFCADCGAAQTPGCAHCGRPLPPRARFCAECGAAAATEPASPARPVAERRVTSVLFGDLVSFTTLSEARDAEEVRELLSGYFERCRAVVARYGGTIEKFVGDAVMAVWGVPVTREDDAERAVRAGLELVDAVAEYGTRIGAPGLAMRVGVVTGEVAVTIGATSEGMVAGDAVNTAARVQGQARPGTVWIDELTRRLTTRVVQTAPTGSHELKGKAEPVTLFEVDAVTGLSAGDRVDRVAAPLVGRRSELAVLRESLHVTEEDPRGRVVVVSGEPGLGKTRLALELEDHAVSRPGPLLWHWTRCLAYGDGVAFSALSAAVRAGVGALESDGPDEIDRKLTSTVARFVTEESERDWLVPRLSLLLGGGGAHEQYAREDLFTAWVAWFDALGADGATVVWVIDDAHHADDGLLDFVEHLTSVARSRVLVVVLARPELLERHDVARWRRTLVLTLEPLTAAAMTGLLTGLVPALPPAAAEVLVVNAEGVPLYAVEIVRALLDRGLLVDGHGAERELAIGVDAGDLAAAGAPTSLQILISSRVDALPGQERALLGVAAVLGQSFRLDGLAALTGLPEDQLTDRLAPLVRRDLVRRVADRRSSEYGHHVFVSTLVRQVVYRTQSRRDRAERHVTVASYLQGLAESTGELSTVIAEHLGAAHDLLPATDPRRVTIAAELLVWLEASAERARSLGAMNEALARWDAALARTDDRRTQDRIRSAAATTANTAAQYERALAYTEPLRDVPPGAPDRDGEIVAATLTQRSKALRNSGRAQQAHDLMQSWQSHTAALSPAAGSAVSRESAAALQQLGRLEDAGPMAERAVRLAEASGRPDLLVPALNVLANGYDDGGLPRVAAAVYRSAADLARTHHLPVELTMVLGNLAAVELNQDPVTGIRSCQEAIELATRIGDSYSVVGAAGNLAEMLRGVGRWDDVHALTELPEIADASAAGVLEVRAVLTNIALVELARGGTPADGGPVDDDTDGYEAVLVPFGRAVAQAVHDPASAFGTARQAVLTSFETFGLSAYFPLMWPVAVDWGIAAGRLDDARTLMSLVTQAPGGRVTPVLRAQLLRLSACLDAAEPSGDPAGIEARLLAAIDALADIGYRPDAARTHLVLGRWLAAQGRHADAQGHLEPATRVLTELGAVTWLAAPADLVLSPD